MTLPLFICIESNCECAEDVFISSKKDMWTYIGVDATLLITSLVLGILGATSVIAMPAAASYGLIGFGVAISLAWIALMIVACKNV